MRFLVSTENEITLFSVFGLFEKIFLPKIKTNQTHFYHHFLFLVKIKTENNQTKYP